MYFLLTVRNQSVLEKRSILDYFFRYYCSRWYWYLLCRLTLPIIFIFLICSSKSICRSKAFSLWFDVWLTKWSWEVVCFKKHWIFIDYSSIRSAGGHEISHIPPNLNSRRYTVAEISLSTNFDITSRRKVHQKAQLQAVLWKPKYYWNILQILWRQQHIYKGKHFSPLQKIAL